MIIIGPLIKLMKNLVKEQNKKLKTALLSINSTDQPEIMELFQSDQFIETNNENYKAIEQVAKKVGIIK